MTKFKILIGTTAIVTMLAIAPASAQLLGGAGNIGGGLGGAIGGATGSVTGSASGAADITADTTGVTSSVSRATAVAERQARQAAREARRAARQAEEQARMTQSVDGNLGGAGALDAGPLSANGSGNVAGDLTADTNPTLDRVGNVRQRATTVARNTTDRVRNTADRAQSAVPNASVNGSAEATASGNATLSDDENRMAQ
jgi:hypothetical protein